MRYCDTHDPFRDSLDSTDLNPAHSGGFCAYVNRPMSFDCGISANIKPDTMLSPVDGEGTRGNLFIIRGNSREMVFIKYFTFYQA